MMHVNAFDRFHEADSRLHRLDPRVKVTLTVLFILSNALLPDGAWAAFGLAWILLLWANHLSDLGLDFTLRRSFLALPFALAAVSAIFSPLGNPLAEWRVGPFALTPTDYGLVKFASILLRSWLSVQAAILLAAVTQFPDMVHAFEHLRVPKILTTIVAFLYRYLFVLTDEAMRLLRARDARSATLPPSVSLLQKWGRNKRGVAWRAKVTGNMAGQLFLRSYERSDRIYNAMLARGYTGQLRTLRPHVMKPGDWLFAALAFGSLLLLQLIGRL
ncbi:MAG: cobalt ECF transporter T component CbiQ [Anaerolineae bacterium CFX3]|nr:cobalt ECF transporter T component CbiQ [Anaerolineae bacterium CFX3]MCQ3946874.1 cobalt ECF transporter T component CbiQ [Anaerolineae bacterium]RIK24511.1 MAG: cobalt ECF transporter T component CbiQ [Anaerolineae bacterium]